MARFARNYTDEYPTMIDAAPPFEAGADQVGSVRVSRTIVIGTEPARPSSLSPPSSSAPARRPQASEWLSRHGDLADRVSTIEALLADAWMGSVDHHVTGYVARFLARFEVVLGALESLGEDANDPRCMHLFSPGSWFSTILHRSYTWGTAIVGDFEEVVHDPGVMDGQAELFGRSRAEYYALFTLAFVEPSLMDARAELASIPRDDHPLSSLAAHVDALHDAIAALNWDLRNPVGAPAPASGAPLQLTGIEMVQGEAPQRPANDAVPDVHGEITRRVSCVADALLAQAARREPEAEPALRAMPTVYIGPALSSAAVSQPGPSPQRPLEEPGQTAAPDLATDDGPSIEVRRLRPRPENVAAAVAAETRRPARSVAPRKPRRIDMGLLWLGFSALLLVGTILGIRSWPSGRDEESINRELLRAQPARYDHLSPRSSPPTPILEGVHE